MRITIANCPPATERFLRGVLEKFTNPAEAGVARLIIGGKLAIRARRDGAPMFIPSLAATETLEDRHTEAPPPTHRHD